MMPPKRPAFAVLMGLARARLADIGTWLKAPGNALLAGVALLLAVHLLLIVFPLGTVSLWSGEPSFHLELQRKAIAAISGAESWPDAARGLLHIFHRYPKVLYDALGVGAGLLFGTGGALRAHITLIAAIQSLLFLALLGIAYFYLRRWFGALVALLGLLFIVTDQYFQVYAVFPRQNIAANALGFLLLFAYLDYRRQAPALEGGPALMLGIGIGIAAMTHYSATELVLMILICELALSLLDRRIASNMLGFAILLAGMAGSIVGADIVFFALKLPAGPSAGLPDAFPVLEGLVHTVLRVYVEGAPREKVEPGWIGFPLGYLIDVANPVLPALIVLGLLAGLLARDRREFRRSLTGDRLVVLSLVLVALYVAAGSRFFAAARTLVFYTPAFLILACFVLATIYRRASAFGLDRRELTILTILIAAVIAAVPAARTLETRAAVRAGSYMDRALARAELRGRPVFQLGSIPDYGLRTAVTQIALDAACSVPDAAIFYAYRSVPIPRGSASPPAQAVLDALRRQEPLAGVRGYAGLALYYYEFPLFPDWLDQQDWLTAHQGLFDAAPLKSAVCTTTHQS